jgi:DNA-directed RNA polymerase subunit RPC12/RpoP
MACPKCSCKVTYQFDDEDDPGDDRLQRCAACGVIFDLDDHEPEDEDEP